LIWLSFYFSFIYYTFLNLIITLFKLCLPLPISIYTFTMIMIAMHNASWYVVLSMSISIIFWVIFWDPQVWSDFCEISFWPPFNHFRSHIKEHFLSHTMSTFRVNLEHSGQFVHSFLDHLYYRVVNRFCKRSFFVSFSKTIVSFSEKTIVFRNDPLVLNF